MTRTRKGLIQAGSALKSIGYQTILTTLLAIMALLNLSNVTEFNATGFWPVMVTTVAYAVPLMVVAGLLKWSKDRIGDWFITLGKHTRRTKAASLWIHVIEVPDAHEHLLAVKNCELFRDARKVNVYWSGIDMAESEAPRPNWMGRLRSELGTRTKGNAVSGRRLAWADAVPPDGEGAELASMQEIAARLLRSSGGNDLVVGTEEAYSGSMLPVGSYELEIRIEGEMPDRSFLEYVEILVEFKGGNDAAARVLAESN